MVRTFVKGFIFKKEINILPFPFGMVKPDDMTIEDFFTTTEEILKDKIEANEFCGYLIVLENENEREEKK